MTTYKQGDVLLVPFPFTDQTTSKQRPAVVLSGAAYNRSHPDIILSSFETSLVRRRLGTLTQPDIHAVRMLFRRILELD